MLRLKLLATATLAAFVTLSATPAAARGEDDGCANMSGASDCLVVMVDHLRRLTLGDEVKSVLIGNPLIADVNMIAKREAVVTARTIGATNLIFVNAEGETIGDFEVVVRETDQQRVVLRQGPRDVTLFQCAPRCERTLTQLDSEAAHSALSAQLTREAQMNSEAAAGNSNADTAVE